MAAAALNIHKMIGSCCATRRSGGAKERRPGDGDSPSPGRRSFARLSWRGSDTSGEGGARRQQSTSTKLQPVRPTRHGRTWSLDTGEGAAAAAAVNIHKAPACSPHEAGRTFSPACSPHEAWPYVLAAHRRGGSGGGSTQYPQSSGLFAPRGMTVRAG